MKKYLLAAVIAAGTAGLAACSTESEPMATAAKTAAATPEPTPDKVALKSDVGRTLGALMEIINLGSSDADAACARIDEFTDRFDDYSAAVDALVSVDSTQEASDLRDELKGQVESVAGNCAMLNGFGEQTSDDQPEFESEPEPEPSMTSAQKNAVESAESYLESGSFSKSGLISQLRYEDFSKKDAKFAVAYLDVNWKDEAVESAESYLESGSFSENGLIEQLEYEGFTSAQARYAVAEAY